MNAVIFESIGIIRTPWKTPGGAPIQPAAADSAEGYVDIDPRFAAGLKDLEGFEPYAPQFDCYMVQRVGWLAGKSPDGRRADDRFAEDQKGKNP